MSNNMKGAVSSCCNESVWIDHEESVTRCNACYDICDTIDELIVPMAEAPFPDEYYQQQAEEAKQKEDTRVIQLAA